MTVQLSRQQRRQMKQLGEKVDLVTESDRRYFERFPDRQHRVRIAGQAEVAQFAIMMGADNAAPPIGFEHYIVVKNVTPGCRIRRPFTSAAGNDVDVSEAEARWLYETTLNSEGRAFDERLRQASEARA